MSETIDCGKCLAKGEEIEDGRCRCCDGTGELKLAETHRLDGHDPAAFIHYTDDIAPLPLLAGLVGVSVAIATLALPEVPLVFTAASLVLALGFLPGYLNQKHNAVGNCWHCGGRLRPLNDATEYQCTTCHWDCPDKITL